MDVSQQNVDTDKHNNIKAEYQFASIKGKTKKTFSDILIYLEITFKVY